MKEEKQLWQWDLWNQKYHFVAYRKKTPMIQHYSSPTSGAFHAGHIKLVQFVIDELWQQIYDHKGPNYKINIDNMIKSLEEI